MEIKHLILEETSLDSLEELLDANAKNGYKTVSMTSCFNPNIESIVYVAVMVKYGGNYTSEDILVQIYNKLDSMDSNLNYIETNTQG